MGINAPSSPFDVLGAVQKKAVLNQLDEWVANLCTPIRNIRDFSDAFERKHGLLARQYLLHVAAECFSAQLASINEMMNDEPTGDFKVLDAAKKRVAKKRVKKWVANSNTFPERYGTFFIAFERKYGALAKLWLLYTYREVLLETVQRSS